MLRHPRAHREDFAVPGALLQLGHVRRWRWLGAENVLEDPFSALHGRCPVGVRRDATWRIALVRDRIPGASVRGNGSLATRPRVCGDRARRASVTRAFYRHG